MGKRKKKIVIYVANVDVMIDGRFNCTIRNHVFDMSKGPNNMIHDLFERILTEKPYLQRVEEFTVIWNDKDGHEMKIDFTPNREINT